MNHSVFSAIAKYFDGILWGVRSTLRSCWTALPYLLSFRSGELRKEVTEQYPDPVSSRTADDLPPRTRGLLFNDIEKCTGCKACEVVCPVNCISVETEKGPEASKAWVSVFDVDFSRCIFCGLCVEACEPASLTHTKEFEGAVFSVPDMVASFGRGRLSRTQKNRWSEQRKDKDLEETTP